ncbi:MAG: flagellar basal body P-ring formation protein FlgA [Nitrospirae bacterium]|nr:flagellar basal body P-ring formation protein FlgA [Nitrospirota bacterium]
MRIIIITLIFTCIAALAPFSCFGELSDDSKVLVEIRRAIQDDLSQSLSPDVEVNSIKVVKGIDFIKSSTTFDSARMSGYSGRNKVNYEIKIRNGAEAFYGLVVEAAYDLMVDVFVSSRALVKGSYLTPDSFFTLKQRLSKIPYGASIQRSDIEGKILKANIGQGVLLKADNFANVLTIKKGQRVDVIVEGSNITLTTKGILRKDAAVGSSALVYCDANKKEINGILLDAGTVKVKI